MQVFGISAGWVNDIERDEMVVNAMIANADSRVYQCGCVVCGKFMRRELVKRSKVSEGDFVRIIYDGFESEVGCQHFEQFRAFEEGVASGNPYSLNLQKIIEDRGRAMIKHGLD